VLCAWLALTDGIADVTAHLVASYLEQCASQKFKINFVSEENIRQVFPISNVKISLKPVPTDHKL